MSLTARVTVFLQLLLVSLTACSGLTLLPPTPTPPPSPAYLTAGPLVFAKKGGIAGFDFRLEIGQVVASEPLQTLARCSDRKAGKTFTLELSAARVKAFLEPLQRLQRLYGSNLEQLAPEYPAEKPVHDGFSYTVTYAGKTVTVFDEAAPSGITVTGPRELKALVQVLDRLMHDVCGW